MTLVFNSDFKIRFQGSTVRAGEAAQSAKCLQSQNPQKKQVQWYKFVISTKEAETGRSWDSLASQLSLLGKFKASERLHLKNTR